MMKAVTFFLCMLIWVSANAATYYVDLDDGCPGSGTSGDPWCALQSAADVVSAGDIVNITGTSNGGATEISANGTSSQPITWRSWPGQTRPNIRNTTVNTNTPAIRIRDGGQYNVFDGLSHVGGRSNITFWIEDTDVNTDFESNLTRTHHITIRNALFEDLGTEKFVNDFMVHFYIISAAQVTIQDSEFRDNWGAGVTAFSSYQVTFSGNLCDGLKPTRTTFGDSTLLHTVCFSANGADGRPKPTFDSNNPHLANGFHTISGNTVRNTVFNNTKSADMFWLDAGAHNVLIDGNEIYGPGSRCIFVEARAREVTISNNIVEECRYGVQLSGFPSAAAEDIVINHNTFDDNIWQGVFFGNSNNVVLENNSISNNGLSQVTTTTETGSITVRNNNLFQGSGAALAVINCTIVNNSDIACRDNRNNHAAPFRESFSTWVSTYGATNSISADPLYVNAAGDDYSLQPNSPNINAGTLASDIGAVESAQVLPTGCP